MTPTPSAIRGGDPDRQTDAVAARTGGPEIIPAVRGLPADACGPPASLLPERAIRRVIFFGKSKSTSGTTRAIVDGLRGAGVSVRWVNCARLRRLIGSRLMRVWARRQFERFQPDLLLSFFCDIPADLLAEFHPRCMTAIWNEECVLPLDGRYRPWIEHCDLMALNNTEQADAYRALGARRVEFVMSAFSPRIHRPLAGWTAPRVEPCFDLVYIGSPGVRDNRAELLDQVARHHRVDVFGRGWEAWEGRSRNLRIHGPVKPAQFARICAQSRIVLGMNWNNAMPLYFSNRTWMTLGCRGFHITHYVPGLEQVFENRRHLIWFRDVGELLDEIRRYLPDAPARERIAQTGHEFVIAGHTYRHRMQEVLRHAQEGAPAAERAVVMPAGVPLVGRPHVAHANGLNGHALNGSANGSAAHGNLANGTTRNGVVPHPVDGPPDRAHPARPG